MQKIKSVLLIDNNEIDNFINHKILENHGVTNIVSFQYATPALSYLSNTKIKFQFILVEIYLPIINGFEFVDKFNELGLDKTHGEICLLSASLNPLHKNQCLERNLRFIEKPLTIGNLLLKTDINSFAINKYIFK